MPYALKPMKPRCRISVLAPFHLHVWPLQASRKLFGNEYEGHEGNFVHDKASFTWATFQKVGFSLFFWKIMAEVHIFFGLLAVSLLFILCWDRTCTNGSSSDPFSKRTMQHMQRLQRAEIGINLLKTVFVDLIIWHWYLFCRAVRDCLNHYFVSVM